MIKLSIVFPIFNSLEFTKRSLKYLEENIRRVDLEKLTTTIIVVNDGSTDGSPEWIQAHHPEIVVLQGNGNLWWSGGMNMGVRYALDIIETDYVLLWNNDLRPKDDYLLQLSEILVSNLPQNIAISKVYIEAGDKKVLFSLGGNFNPRTGKHGLIGCGKEESFFTPPSLEINWFPGMGTTIHRCVFEKIGLFDDKNFPQYKGDSDFALRAFAAGFKILLHEKLILWNDRENTGYSNDKSWGIFYNSLTTRKSNTNIYRDILFYSRHGESILVYTELFKKYIKHIGGFFKWKFLKLFGLKRKNRF
jgi:GT2 family glycosyltransferase